MNNLMSKNTYHIALRIGIFAILVAIWDVVMPEFELNIIYVGAISAVIALQTNYQYSN